MLFAREFVVSAGDPLHRRGAWIHHWRSSCDSRLGGPALLGLALAIGCAAAHFHPAIVSRFGIAMVDLEIWREVAGNHRSVARHGESVSPLRPEQRSDIRSR